MSNLYKKFYKLELIPQTALQIGTGEIDPVLDAQQLLQNGLSELVYHGTSLAGIFFHTLKNRLGNMGNTDLSLITKIKGKYCSKQNNIASYLSFRTAVIAEKNLMIRDRVKIDKKTKTAEDHSKFAYWEIEPKDLKLEVIIELDNVSHLHNHLKQEEVTILETYINAVLYSWKEEGIAFGSHSSSGNGWCILKKATFLEISDRETYQQYLDLNFNDFTKMIVNELPIIKPDNYQYRYKKYKLTLEIKEEDDGYGIDSLLIKGGDSHRSINNNDVDDIFIHNGEQLIVPGSSIKGVFSSYLHKKNSQEWEEFTGQKGNKHKSYILFEDLIALVNTKNNLYKIERHAEDEFTRAVYEKSKFNQERLLQGIFTGYIKVISEKTKEFEDKFLEKLRDGAKRKLISIGSGSCYPFFKIEEEVCQ